MGWRVCAVALCALAVVGAGAYTVDCNHEYTDCETELSKIGSDDEDTPSAVLTTSIPYTRDTAIPAPTPPPFLPTIPPREVPATKIQTTTTTTEATETTEAQEVTEPPKQARLLNLNVDELQNFANALHNETTKQEKQKMDLSDVNMDDEDTDPTRLIAHDHSKHDKPIPDKFFTNLQEPFRGLLTIDRASEEVDTCRDNEVTYKIGDRIERGCEETCECTPSGTFDCSPRCKHPYIRRGRRLSDPLCFESPVDECCSIIACSTSNQEIKANKVEVCRYNNDTHQVGEKWNIGCEQTCSCEANSIVTCKPRCKKLLVSDKCINVQDPNDECCEVQVCDVSQDVHEELVENHTTSTTTTSTEKIKLMEDYSDALHNVETKQTTFQPTAPPVIAEPEPIGSVKVLQNNSVQVNLQHVNTTEDPVHLLLSSDGGKSFKDVELKYSNLIIDLPRGKDYILKTKETGTKFNFTITTVKDEMMSENGTVNIKEKVGCEHDGNFYEVGEEFHIGCTELCECTGTNTKECVELVCPSHVGLELVSKGCVRWAPSPPPQPPNCCPRAARCLSDGTCYYKGIPVPNWSEVPIALTGCSQRCFCENGELDCQEVCSPLPALPPPTLRCPPLHRPAPVNISDEDCCKQWGCVLNAEAINATTLLKYDVIPVFPNEKAVMTVMPEPAPAPTPSPQVHDPTIVMTIPDFYKHLHPVKSMPKINKIPPAPVEDTHKYSVEPPKTYKMRPIDNNLTVFAFDDMDLPYKIIEPTDPVVTPRYGPLKRPPELIGKSKPVKCKYVHKPTSLSYFEPSDEKMHKLLHTPDESVKPKPMSFFIPAYNPGQDISEEHMHRMPLKYFMAAEVVENKTDRFLLKKPSSVSFTGPRIFKSGSPTLKTYSKQMTGSHDTGVVSMANRNSKYEQNRNSHLLFQEPNPYESVLLRPVPYMKVTFPRLNGLNLDQLMNEMDGGNRNRGRSADHTRGVTGQTSPPDTKPVHSQTPFLPTIPPEIHFPTDDLPDYDQNNLHRPINSRDPILAGLPPGLTIPPNYGDENKKLTVLSLQADSPTSVKLLFGLPPVLVGLRGSVDLRYTDKADEDIAQWYSQVFAPADEVLTTPRLEFRLTGLKPSTTYKIKGKLFLHNLPVEPQSQVYSIRTLDLPTVIPIEEKRKEIDSRLMLVDVNDTAAHISWRHFTEDELQFIDGIQVRYRPVGTPIYSMTELLHHSRSIAELHDLRPNTHYEASLILVPPPRATTELHDPGRVEFTTAPFVDPYNWTVTIESHVVGSDAAELTWHGVPSPAERWVRVYRAAHACGASRHEHDAFRLATRDLPPTIMLSGLDPNTRCRVWMELFLTNGKIKTSNVLEIVTKSQDSPEEIDNEIEASSIADSRGSGRGDYYGALVVVGVVAALGALTSLLLLLVLVRRHRPRSVPITPVPTAPRESSLPPYDNPAYKLELQQETMDL